MSHLAMMDSDLVRTLRRAVMFNRIAGIILRDIAKLELELDLAESLQRIADQLEADAAAIDRRLPPMPSISNGAADQSHVSALADLAAG